MDFGLIYLYTLVFISGACIGSFLNVVIYRLPLEKFFENNRSYCPNCQKQIKTYDLIPIFSYVFLKGKCRYCQNKISIRYPIIEFIGGILAVFCLNHFINMNQALLAFALSMILLAIAVIDLDTMEIPDSLNLSVLILGILFWIIEPKLFMSERIIGFLIISVPMLILTLCIKDAFGGGDIKLIAGAGFLLGWKLTIVAFAISLLFGGIYAFYLLLSKKSQFGAHFAFGPFLCSGIFISLCYGQKILEWYLAFLY